MHYYWNKLNMALLRRIFTDWIVLVLLGLGAMIGWGEAHAAFTCVNSNSEVVTWTVGHPVPSFNLGDINQLACAASFQELDYLRNKFDGLPMTNKGGRIVIWRGYNAAFILDNL